MRVKLIGCQPKPFTFSSYLTEQGFFFPPNLSLREDDPTCGSELNTKAKQIMLVCSPCQISITAWRYTWRLLCNYA